MANEKNHNLKSFQLNKINLIEASKRISRSTNLDLESSRYTILDYAKEEKIILSATFSKETMYMEGKNKKYTGKIGIFDLEPKILQTSSYQRINAKQGKKGTRVLTYNASHLDNESSNLKIQANHVYISIDDIEKIESSFNNTPIKDLVIEEQQKEIDKQSLIIKDLQNKINNWRPAFEYKSDGMNFIFDLIEDKHMNNGKQIPYKYSNELPTKDDILTYFSKNFPKTQQMPGKTVQAGVDSIITGISRENRNKSPKIKAS